MHTWQEWVIDNYDGFEALRLQACRPEEPGPTDVRLRVEAFALNWGDADLMRNAYSFSFSCFPARVGIEASGIVEAVGPQVKGIEIGQRYCTLPYFYDNRGASANTLLIDQAYITAAPENLSAVESASVWMQFMTAYFPIVELAQAAPGKHLFIPAGTSTSGSAAIQIAKLAGATVTSSTRQQKNTDLIRSFGADHVFVDDGSDLKAYLLEVSQGAGVDASFDPVGGEFIPRYADAMTKGGLIMCYGGLAGSYDSPPFMSMIQRNLWFHAYSLFNYVENSQACERGKAYVYSALCSGKLCPNIDRIFPMQGYVDAWRYLKGNRDSYGKVLINTRI